MLDTNLQTEWEIDLAMPKKSSRVDAIDSSVSLDSHDGAALLPEVARRAKLMIVDDEPLNIKAVEKHLRCIGYENFITTSDSTQAIAKMQREEPDLVLLDIMMPGINGVELLRMIRSVPSWCSIPVIMLTAQCDQSTKREALNCGATDFLAKPIDAHELALRVRNVLIAKALHDQVAMRASQLEGEIQRQSQQLGNARHEAELRYAMGKAEIATDVLHNVGNALQSVNTGVSLVAYTVRESKVRSLKRAIDLLEQNSENLPRFLSKDERGKILPSYLVELANALLLERDKVSSEIESLTKHLEHINAVVGTQQKYAASCRITENVSLDELVRDVEGLVGGSFTQLGIAVQRDYCEIPPVKTDRQKLLQVVLNIAKNAVDSLKQAHKDGQGRLTIRIGCRTEHRVFLEVTDNGVGIPRENLVKIFNHGFTTKKNGHGFGLHSCANIMKELGGSLAVSSMGLGQGATFVLELPLEIEDRN